MRKANKNAIGPPNNQMKKRNKNVKGKSTTVVNVADVIKSRTESKSRSIFAKDPLDVGRCANFMFRTWSNILRPAMISTRLPAISIKYPRKVRIIKSKTKIVSAPKPRTQPVSIALFGITRL